MNSTESPKSNDEIPEHELETIKALGLTNFEWMRMRLNGELPERAEGLLKKRLKDQTSKPLNSLKPISSETAHVDGDFEQYKSRSLKELDESLELSGDRPDWKGILQRAVNFQKSAREFYTAILTNKEYAEQVTKKLDAIFSSIQNKIREPEAKTEDRAKGFVVLEKFLDYAPSSDLSDRLAEELQQRIRTRDFPVFKILLKEGGHISDAAFIALFKAHKESVYASVGGFSLSAASRDNSDFQLEKELEENIAESLTVCIQKKVKQTGLENITDETQYLNWLIENLQVPGIFQELTAHGFDLKKIADNYISALMQKYDEIGGGYPSHSQTSNIINLIGNLYSPINGQKLPVSDDAIKLIRKLYREKIVAYEIDMRERRSWIESVAAKLGLNPDVIETNPQP